MGEHSEEFETLRPMLHEAHERLEEALDEACDAKPAKDETTGEMIRLEETLSVAAEAAKRAVSIRRRLREEEDRTRRERPEQREHGHGSQERTEPPPADA